MKMKKQALYSSTGKLSTASFPALVTGGPNARHCRKINSMNALCVGRLDAWTASRPPYRRVDGSPVHAFK
jgi:hypothetical protein